MGTGALRAKVMVVQLKPNKDTTRSDAPAASAAAPADANAVALQAVERHFPYVQDRVNKAAEADKM